MRQLLSTTCARIGRAFLAVSASLSRPDQGLPPIAPVFPDARPVASPPAPAASPATACHAGVPARRNEVYVDVLGERLCGPSQKDVTIRALQAIAAREPSCLPRIREATRKRDRVYVTDNLAEMYPRRSAHLGDKYAEIVPGWYMATNFGAKEFATILRAACEAMGLEYGRDVRP